MRLKLLLFLLPLSFLFACKQAPEHVTLFEENKQHLPPEDRYGPLLKEVQMAQVFPDGKTFVDCVPKYPTDEILAKYSMAKKEGTLDIKKFVEENFELPHRYASNFNTDTTRTAVEHINALWPVLTRQPEEAENGTLIGLPNPYIVPGGRFGEIYYWDSYFTMLGLQAAGNVEMVQNMVDNFAFLVDSIGYIPNGNRTYFLSRSQPPFFSMMVGILAQMKGERTIVKYLPQLEKEYSFWMDGAEQLTAEKTVHRRVVRLEDGTTLHRYWDDKSSPRAEMYRDDVETAKKSDRPAKEVYRDLRAACESGWDFSSRWFQDQENLTTIHTTDLVQVDLNALLYHLERVLERAYTLDTQVAKADQFSIQSANRRTAIQKYFWNGETGYFHDYNYKENALSPPLTLAGMYPLFFGVATKEQAQSAAEVIENQFLQPGGVVTTLNQTGQQWDAPNGWAPLQWITISGLRNYGQNDLAETIKDRWVDLNVRVYENTGKMVEKYNVMDMGLEAGGGEYPVQDGFGWTNGVLLRLLLEDRRMD